MKNNLASLPSGTVLNLDLVAYVAVLPGAADRRKKMRVVFGYAGPGGAAANMQLDEEDSNALIDALEELGVDVTALRQSIRTRK
jgi:hypothetical protein